MKKKLYIFFILTFLSFSAFAQIIVSLKNGRQMEGALVSMDEKKITIAVPSRSGIMKTSISREDVDNIKGLSFDEFLRVKNTRETLVREGHEGGFQASFKDGLKLIEEKRQRPFLLEVKPQVLNREEIKAYLKKQLESSHTEDELAKDEKLLVKLGLLSRGANYKEMIIELFTRNIAGLYDAKENKMYMSTEAASVISPLLPSEVLMHELAHALQDQYVFLDRLEDDLKDSSDDKALAVRAIIEGEATFVSYSIFADYLKKVGSTKMSPEKLQHIDLERFILESMLLATESLSEEYKNKGFMQYLLFPYAKGGLFIKYAFDNGNWKAVDEIYKNFPQSTEQIIHPEKYFLVKDEPSPLEKIDFAQLKQAGFQEVKEGVLGEFTLYSVADVFLDDLYAKMLSSGWGNDYYYLYEKEDKKILILNSVWDSPMEAEEFLKGMKMLLDKKYDKLAWQQNSNMLTGENENNLIYLEKNETRVIVIESESKDKQLFSELIAGATSLKK